MGWGGGGAVEQDDPMWSGGVEGWRKVQGEEEEREMVVVGHWSPLYNLTGSTRVTGVQFIVSIGLMGRGVGGKDVERIARSAGGRRE